MTLSGPLSKRPAAVSARPGGAPPALVDELCRNTWIARLKMTSNCLCSNDGFVGQAGWPNLAKMVRQHWVVPASSAGVERVFSAAGKLHDERHKSVKDETLEASMILAAFNHSD